MKARLYKTGVGSRGSGSCESGACDDDDDEDDDDDDDAEEEEKREVDAAAVAASSEQDDAVGEPSESPKVGSPTVPAGVDAGDSDAGVCDSSTMPALWCNCGMSGKPARHSAS